MCPTFLTDHNMLFKIQLSCQKNSSETQRTSLKMLYGLYHIRNHYQFQDHT